MKILRQIISVFLLISIVCSTVFAEDKKTLIENVQYNESKKILDALDISLPFDVSDDSRNVTKSEFVYLIIKAMKLDASTNSKYLEFSDVKLDYWAHDAIIIAKLNGIIMGRDNNLFGIDDLVTRTQAGKIAMDALGFSVFNTYKDSATYSNIYNQLLKNISTSENITVKDVYQIITNLLLSSYVKQTLFGEQNEFTVVSSETYLEYRYEVYKATGIVTGTPYSRLGIGDNTAAKSTIEIDGNNYKNYSDDSNRYLGYKVDYFVSTKDSDPKVIYMAATKSNDVTLIKGEDIIDISIDGDNVIVNYEKTDGIRSKMDFPRSCDFIYNGKVVPFDIKLISVMTDKKAGNIEIINNTKTVVVNLTVYDTILTEAVSVFDNVVTGKYGEIEKLETESGKDFIVITKNGKKIKISEIKQGDVLFVKKSLDGNSKEVTVTNIALTGKITSYTAGESIMLDDVPYDLSNYYKSVSGKDKNIPLGTEVKLIFNSIGQIIDVDTDFTTYEGQYAFLVDSHIGSGVERKATVKVVTLDCKMMVYDLESKVSLNDGKKDDAATVLTSNVFMQNGEKVRGMIYYELSKENKIRKIVTPQKKTTDSNGNVTLENENDILDLDAPTLERKCKGSMVFLSSTNDSDFPEFYMDNNTKVLVVPPKDADDEEFNDVTNYSSVLSSSFIDASNHIVEAYNVSDYNVAGFVIEFLTMTYITSQSDHSIFVVSGISQAIDEEGVEIKMIVVYEDGEKKKIPLRDDQVMLHNGVEIKTGDIIRLHLNNNGVAIVNQYLGNVHNIKIDDFSGRNDGNAYITGYVVSRSGNYTKLKITDNDNNTIRERIIYGTVTPTIYDTKTDKMYKGSIDDLTLDAKVFVRVCYSTIRSIVIIKYDY